MKAARSVRRLLVVAALGATAVAAVSAAPATPVSAVVGCTMCAGGEYHALDTPVRAYDSVSRFVFGSPGDASGVTADLLALTSGTPLLGSGVARSDVLSLVATVTAVRPLSTGSLKVYPGAETAASMMYFRAGQTTSNWALITPDADGKVHVKAITPSTVKNGVQVYIDVVGWYSTSGYKGADAEPGTDDDHGLRMRGTTSVRIAASANAVTPAAPLTVPIRTGTNLVTGKPIWGTVEQAATIQSVLLNVTATKPAVASTVLVQATDAAPSTAQSMTVNANDTVSTLVTTRVGADGSVVVRVPVGATKVTVDLVGIFYTVPADETTKGRVVPLTLPFRALDTRNAEFGAVPLGPKQAEDWSFAAFANSVKVGGLAVGAQNALIGNLTSTALTRQYPTVPVSSSLAVYQPGASVPVVANVNSAEGVTTANATLFTYGTNAVSRIYNRAGYAHYLLDVYAVVLS